MVATPKQPETPKRRGRRSKYTTETIEKVLHAIRMGATYEIAARSAGISPDTLTNWQKQYSDFSDKMREAEGVSARVWLEKIENAADVDWKAAAWKLERRFPKEYGKQADTAVTINLSQDAIRQLADEYQIDPAEVTAEYNKILRNRKDQVMNA